VEINQRKRKDSIIFLIVGIVIIILATLSNRDMSQSQALSITNKSVDKHTLTIDNKIIKINNDSLQANPELGKALEILELRLGYDIRITFN